MDDSECSTSVRVSFGGGAGALIEEVVVLMDLEESAKSEKEDLVDRAGEGEGEGDRLEVEEEEREKEDRRERDPSSFEGDNEGPDVEEGESLVLLKRGIKLLNPEEVLMREGKGKGSWWFAGQKEGWLAPRLTSPSSALACLRGSKAASFSHHHRRFSRFHFHFHHLYSKQPQFHLISTIPAPSPSSTPSQPSPSLPTHSP